MKMQITKTFEIDEKIAPYIKKLNDKGYITEFSCSGHPEKHRLGYITFDVCTSNDLKDNKVKPPKGWFYSPTVDNRETIRMNGALDKDFIFSGAINDEYIDTELQALDKWTELLPINKTCMYTVDCQITEESLT